jgi:hypothetical protein
MAILDLQQRSREMGRIRIGQVVKTSNGKTRPDKLDRFRLTSPSKVLLDQVAALYGGDVVEWEPQGGGPKQWEVITTSTRLPVLIPPQPVSQYYELWQAGGCKRRCDGVTELLSDKPCICGPDPEERKCKPTTRLNVVLRDVPGIGVFRLETHGYYAAVELPQVAQFLAQTSGYVQAHLGLEERIVKREVDGKPETRRFMVPILEVDITPAQLLAGGGGITPAAIEGNAPAQIEAGPSAAETKAAEHYFTAAAVATQFEEIRALWHEAQQAGALTEQLSTYLTERGNALQNPRALPQPAPTVDDAAEVDGLWMQIIAAAPDDWTTSQLRAEFAEFNGGVSVDSASASEMSKFLTHLRSLTAVGG